MTLVKQFTFVADTTIDPDEVNANFDDIVGAINTDVALLAGAAFTAIPTAPATMPTSANQLTRKAYVDARIKGGTFSETTGLDGTITFAHGLGVTPTSVVATLRSSQAAGITECRVSTFDATNIVLKMWDTSTDEAGSWHIGQAYFGYWQAVTT
jgi:hypothetical protein